MTGFKKIRWTAFLFLGLGLILAVGAGLVESEALAAQEVQFAHSATSMAGKLFTASAVLMLIWAMEWQRIKMAARLEKLEEELKSVKTALAPAA
jgi:hypothetical protein